MRNCSKKSTVSTPFSQSKFFASADSVVSVGVPGAEGAGSTQNDLRPACALEFRALVVRAEVISGASLHRNEFVNPGIGDAGPVEGDGQRAASASESAGIEQKVERRLGPIDPVEAAVKDV